MSLIKHAAAAAGFVAATTAAAQDVNADMVPHIPQTPVKAMIMQGATERIGTAPPIESTRAGKVLTTKIYDGPMTDQTITLNTATDELSVRYTLGENRTMTSHPNFIAMPQDVRGPIFSSTSYNSKSGFLSATCTVEKISSLLKAGTRDDSPENILYEFNCKTGLGNGFLQIAPHASKGVYHYRLGHAIEADPKTGDTNLRILNRIAEFSYN